MGRPSNETLYCANIKISERERGCSKGAIAEVTTGRTRAGRDVKASLVMRHWEEQQTWILMDSINRRKRWHRQPTQRLQGQETDWDGEDWPERTEGTRREAEGKRDLIQLMGMMILQGRLSSLGGHGPDRHWPTAASALLEILQTCKEFL